MGETISLGRIAGVRVGLNWTMLLIFWLVTASLAQTFEAEVDGLAAGAAWLVATLTAVAFYGSLLAHELGHAVVARRRGVDVEAITLWLFGGVAKLKGDALTPGGEARIGLAGPAVTVGLVAVLSLAAWALGAVGAPDAVLAPVVWLAAMNLMLLVFNLVPAFPLDGGRALRAWLWHRRGDRISATVSAARAGRGFGILLVTLGLVWLVTVAAVDGLWFVFLGWFLISAARAEERAVVTRSAVGGLRVREVMSPDPVAVPGWMTVAGLIGEFLSRYRYGAFPVRDLEGRITGLITLRQAAAVPPDRRGMVRVADVAGPEAALTRAAPDDLLADLLQRIGFEGGVRVLVFDADRLVGILCPSDVARAVQLGRLRTPTAGRAA